MAGKTAGAEIEIPAPAPLTTIKGEVVVPGTGQIIDPAGADHVVLGELLRRIRDHEDQLKAAKRLVNAEVIARMDADACWTMGFGAGKLSAPSPRDVLYDGDRLKANLKPLVKTGKISKKAMEAAVRPETVQKPMKGGIKKLLALGDEDVTKAVEMSSEPDERPRTVRVEVQE